MLNEFAEKQKLLKREAYIQLIINNHLKTITCHLNQNFIDGIIYIIQRKWFL